MKIEIKNIILLTWIFLFFYAGQLPAATSTWNPMNPLTFSSADSKDYFKWIPGTADTKKWLICSVNQGPTSTSPEFWVTFTKNSGGDTARFIMAGWNNGQSELQLNGGQHGGKAGGQSYPETYLFLAHAYDQYCYKLSQDQKIQLQNALQNSDQGAISTLVKTVLTTNSTIINANENMVPRPTNSIGIRSTGPVFSNIVCGSYDDSKNVTIAPVLDFSANYQLPSPGSGQITFNATGTNFFIILSPSNLQTQLFSGLNGYMINFSSVNQQNQYSIEKITSGAPATLASSPAQAQLSNAVNQTGPMPYWITVKNNGGIITISAGIGSTVGTNQVIQCTDSFPLESFQYIGLGCGPRATGICPFSNVVVSQYVQPSILPGTTNQPTSSNSQVGSTPVTPGNQTQLAQTLGNEGTASLPVKLPDGFAASPNAFTKPNGDIKAIAVGSCSATLEAWLLNSAGKLFRYDEDSMTSDPWVDQTSSLIAPLSPTTLFVSISVSSDGYLLAADNTGVVWLFDIAKNTWSQLASTSNPLTKFDRVAIGNQSCIFAIEGNIENPAQSTNKIFQYLTGTWQPVKDAKGNQPVASQIAAGLDGTIMAIGITGKAYAYSTDANGKLGWIPQTYTDASGKQMAVPLTQIAVGNAGNIWGVNSSNGVSQVWQKVTDATTQQSTWQMAKVAATPGSSTPPANASGFDLISVNAAGTVVAVDDEENIYNKGDAGVPVSVEQELAASNQLTTYNNTSTPAPLYCPWIPGGNTTDTKWIKFTANPGQTNIIFTKQTSLNTSTNIINPNDTNYYEIVIGGANGSQIKGPGVTCAPITVSQTSSQLYWATITAAGTISWGTQTGVKPNVQRTVLQTCKVTGTPLAIDRIGFRNATNITGITIGSHNVSTSGMNPSSWTYDAASQNGQHSFFPNGGWRAGGKTEKWITFHASGNSDINIGFANKADIDPITKLMKNQNSYFIIIGGKDTTGKVNAQSQIYRGNFEYGMTAQSPFDTANLLTPATLTATGDDYWARVTRDGTISWGTGTVVGTNQKQSWKDVSFTPLAVRRITLVSSGKMVYTNIVTSKGSRAAAITDGTVQPASESSTVTPPKTAAEIIAQTPELITAQVIKLSNDRLKEILALSSSAQLTKALKLIVPKLSKGKLNKLLSSSLTPTQLKALAPYLTAYQIKYLVETRYNLYRLIAPYLTAIQKPIQRPTRTQAQNYRSTSRYNARYSSY